MSAQSNAAPVIIKRKKVVSGGGHHGGAWKVAIAFPLAVGAFAPVTYSVPKTGTAQAVVLTSAANGMFPAAPPVFRMQAQIGPHSANGMLNPAFDLAGI